jgi:hypothetical protein
VSTFEKAGKLHALLADGVKGLKIIDISDPSKPVLKGSLETDGTAYNVRYFKNAGNCYALIADGNKGLKTVNITDPSKPVL